MSEEPKILFAGPPSCIINGLPLTVSPATSDILAAVHFGHAQAIEMFRTVTQPDPQPPMNVVPSFGEAGEDEEIGPGVLDVGSLWRMGPEAREAILSRHGLQVYQPPEAEEDPVHKDMADFKTKKSEEIY